MAEDLIWADAVWTRVRKTQDARRENLSRLEWSGRWEFGCQNQLAQLNRTCS